MSSHSSIGVRIVSSLTILAHLMVCWPSAVQACVCSTPNQKLSEACACASGSNSSNKSKSCCKKDSSANSSKKSCCDQKGGNSNKRSTSVSDTPTIANASCACDQCGCAVAPRRDSDRDSIPPTTTETERLVEFLLPAQTILVEDSPSTPLLSSWAITNPLLLKNLDLVILLTRFHC